MHQQLRGWTPLPIFVRPCCQVSCRVYLSCYPYEHRVMFLTWGIARKKIEGVGFWGWGLPLSLGIFFMHFQAFITGKDSVGGFDPGTHLQIHPCSHGFLWSWLICQLLMIGFYFVMSYNLRLFYQFSVIDFTTDSCRPVYSLRFSQTVQHFKSFFLFLLKTD